MFDLMVVDCFGWAFVAGLLCLIVLLLLRDGGLGCCCVLWFCSLCGFAWCCYLVWFVVGVILLLLLCKFVCFVICGWY